MKKYAVQIKKQKNVSEKDFNNDNKTRNMYSKFDKYLHHRNLSSLSQDKISRALQKFFRKYDRSNINTSVEFDRKERVLINEVGKWETDQAVYDKKTKIPKHLRKPLKVEKN